MHRRTPVVHVAVGVAVFAFWFLLTRNYHPTLVIGVLTTALLVAAFAGAVYINSYLLLSRLAERISGRMSKGV